MSAIITVSVLAVILVFVILGHLVAVRSERRRTTLLTVDLPKKLLTLDIIAGDRRWLGNELSLVKVFARDVDHLGALCVSRAGAWCRIPFSYYHDVDVYLDQLEPLTVDDAKVLLAGDPQKYAKYFDIPVNA